MERSGNPAQRGCGECERINKLAEFLTVARSTAERQNIPCSQLDVAKRKSRIAGLQDLQKFSILFKAKAGDPPQAD